MVLHRILLRTAFAAAACVSLVAPLQAGPQATPDLATQLADYARPDHIPQPKGNPATPLSIELGKTLFFDPRLSGSGMISCASCHNPSLGWADGLPKGLGHMGTRLGRHTPTILN